MEGDSLSRQLLTELKSIESREDLVQAGSKLKKRFNELVDLMIDARTFQQTYPDEEISLSSSIYSEAILNEFKRIYALEGGREAIEKAQQEALFRLDAFEHSLAKQKTHFKK